MDEIVANSGFEPIWKVKSSHLGVTLTAFEEHRKNTYSDEQTL